MISPSLLMATVSTTYITAPTGSNAVGEGATAITAASRTLSTGDFNVCGHAHTSPVMGGRFSHGK